MKLLRFIVIEMTGSPGEWMKCSFSVADVHLSIQHSWEKQGKHFLLACADIVIDPKIEVNADGYVVIPDKQRKQAEEALENLANLIAVSTRSARRITSPIPYFAMLPEDSELLSQLQSTKGLFLPNGGICTASYEVSVDDCINHLSDRLDGVALLAEVLAQEHLVGRVRELFRFFERAFKTDGERLGTLLKQFLQNTPNKFSAQELNEWVRFRGQTIHADRSNEFLLERDLRMTAFRMEEAGYDVLFNKDQWRDASTARRSNLRLPGGSRENTGHLLFKTPSSTIRAQFQFLDASGAYPINLEMDLTQRLLPECYATSSGVKPPSTSSDNVEREGTEQPTEQSS